MKRPLLLLLPLLCLSLIQASCRNGGVAKQHTTPLPDRPDTVTLRLVFAGDIMAHMPQVKAAYRAAHRSYDFSPTFDSIEATLQSADLTVGNLETTIGGTPYSGYPAFSSPPSLVSALKECGFDLLTTANNHSADRGKRGVLGTLGTLDSLGLRHTGSYASQTQRDSLVPLIVPCKGLRLAFFAYTYGLNGLPMPAPTVIDLIDTVQMAADLAKADAQGCDYKIVCIHWGTEYQRNPNPEQERLAAFLRRHGVDMVIGSHPHVVQKSLLEAASDRDFFLIYSMGNFASNQIKPAGTRGGMLLELTLTHVPNGHSVITPRYRYVFMQKKERSGRAVYRLLPVTLSEPTQYNGRLSAAEQQDYSAFCRYYSGIPLAQ